MSNTLSNDLYVATFSHTDEKTHNVKVCLPRCGSYKCMTTPGIPPELPHHETLPVILGRPNYTRVSRGRSSDLNVHVIPRFWLVVLPEMLEALFAVRIYL